MEPEIATAVTALAALSVVTAKADAAAVVDESASLYVRTTLVPSVDVAADVNVGAVPATVELLVTEVLVKDAASLPAES